MNIQEYKKLSSEGKLIYKGRKLIYNELIKNDKTTIISISVYDKENNKINELEAYKRFDLVNTAMLKDLDELICS